MLSEVIRPRFSGFGTAIFGLKTNIHSNRRKGIGLQKNANGKTQERFSSLTSARAQGQKNGICTNVLKSADQRFEGCAITCAFNVKKA